MTVKQLKEQLAGVPDGAVLVIEGGDHSYLPASVDLVDAEHDRESEYWGEHYEGYPVQGGCVVRKVLLFS